MSRRGWFFLLLPGLAAGCARPGRAPGGSAAPAASWFSEKPYQPPADTGELHPEILARQIAAMRSQSDEQLQPLMNDKDYDRRAAAARLILERMSIPCSAEGLAQVRAEYLATDNPVRLNYGFYLVGLLAANGVAPEEIQRLTLDYVEAHPQDRVDDQALWALGETGRREALAEFLRIADAPGRYGQKARERSFCCISDCGRYGGKIRYEKIPDILALARRHPGDAQTERWCLLALSTMAPGVEHGTLEEWRQWWERQTVLKNNLR